MTELLTTADVAAIVHAPADTVRFWRSQGNGPRYARIGKRVLYCRDDVEHWISTRFE
jgi:DNA-binding transcriptional MerR regulator